MTGIAWSDIAFGMRDDADEGAEDIGRLQESLPSVDGKTTSFGEVDEYLTALPLFRERVPTPEWMRQVWCKEMLLDSERKAELDRTLAHETCCVPSA